MGHNVGDAAANAVKKSERKATEVQTPAQLIDALRKNYRANLYIPMHQIGALLAAYDEAVSNIIILGSTAEALTARVKGLTEEKQVMTDTILGFTQEVQELQAVEDKVRTDISMLGLAPFVHMPTDLGIEPTLDIKS